MPVLAADSVLSALLSLAFSPVMSNTDMVLPVSPSDPHPVINSSSATHIVSNSTLFMLFLPPENIYFPIAYYIKLYHKFISVLLN
jgi:hypothetical protein